MGTEALLTPAETQRKLLDGAGLDAEGEPIPG
jgi:hypothetical protein